MCSLCWQCIPAFDSSLEVHTHGSSLLPFEITLSLLAFLFLFNSQCPLLTSPTPLLSLVPSHTRNLFVHLYEIDVTRSFVTQWLPLGCTVATDNCGYFCLWQNGCKEAQLLLILFIHLTFTEPGSPAEIENLF